MAPTALDPMESPNCHILYNTDTRYHGTGYDCGNTYGNGRGCGTYNTNSLIIYGTGAYVEDVYWTYGMASGDGEGVTRNLRYILSLSL